MIQFACPGCATIYTVGDEQAGKVGKCPKCQAKFTIPSRPAPAPPPPPPVEESPSADTVRCPLCRAKLSIEGVELTAEVACPYCNTVFKLKPRGGEPAPSSVPILPVLPEPDEQPQLRNDDPEEPEPPRRRRDDFDDEVDDILSRRPRRDTFDVEEEEPAPRSQPRRRRTRRRSRGSWKAIPRIISGILSLLIGTNYIVCGVLLAVAGSFIMRMIGVMGPQGDQPGAGQVQGLAGVGMGAFICCGLFTVVFGAIYIMAGIGALGRKQWGRTWTVVVGVLSCLFVLSELFGGARPAMRGDARTIGIACVQVVFFAGHAVACFLAAFGDGADAEFNRP